MIPAFVISLLDSTERRANIKKDLDNASIPFEFFDAIDGRETLPDEYEQSIDRQKTLDYFGQGIVDAEYACALSHMGIYAKMVQEGIQWALVMEDDARVTPDLVEYIEGRYFESADLTQVGFVTTLGRRLGVIEVFGQYRSYLRTKTKSYGAYGYIISIEAAKHFLKHEQPVYMFADWPPSIHKLIRRKRVRVVHPQLITHAGQHSVIGKEGGRDKFLKAIRDSWKEPTQKKIFAIYPWKHRVRRLRDYLREKIHHRL